MENIKILKAFIDTPFYSLGWKKKDIMIYYYFKAADVKWEKTMATIEQIDASSSLYQEDLPAMNQMTFCFWFQGQNEMNDLSYMISIATPGINRLHRLNLHVSVWFTNIFY